MVFFRIITVLFAVLSVGVTVNDLAAAEHNYSRHRTPCRKHIHQHAHRKTVYYKSLQECLQNSKLSPEERQFLSKVLDNVENSAIGKKVIAQLEERFDFAFQFVKFAKDSTWGTYSPGVIKLNSNFLKGKCKHVKLHNLILCASVVVHEMTHSVHRKNNIRLLSKEPSWESRLKDLMLRELHCRVNQFELSAELVNLLWSDEYRQSGHGHRFMALHEAAAWNSIVEAKVAEGMDSFQAEAFARKALIEHLWRNPQKEEYVSGQKVKFQAAKIWHKSYGPASGKLPARNGSGGINYKDAKRLVELLDGGVSYSYLMQNFPYIIRRDRIDSAPWCFREYWYPAKMQQAANNGQPNDRL